MTSDELVYTTVTDGTKTPGARMMWGPRACVPPMPYFTYERTDGGETFGDNRNLPGVPHYRVTLFTAEPDERIEATFAEVVGTLGPYRRSWEHDHEHEAYVTHFDLALTRRAE